MGLPMSEECMTAHPSGSLDTRHTTIVLICSVVYKHAPGDNMNEAAE